jgi:hypothetical protein
MRKSYCNHSVTHLVGIGKARPMIESAKMIIKENGILGLYSGFTPRVIFAAWQTMFMISIPYILNNNR